MSRFTGPRVKKMRALGTDLPGLSRKSMWDRPYPPGQHGAKQARRRKMSDFKKQLLEKQKLRFNYGLTERQFMRLYKEAVHSKSPSGDKLIELLERRLDNVVFRAGFAPTGVMARQLVRHGHVRLNGRRADIPSIRVRVGDRIELTERARRIPIVVSAMAEPALARPEWIHAEEGGYAATVTRLPDRSEVPFPVEIQHVVEHYAVRL